MERPFFISSHLQKQVFGRSRQAQRPCQLVELHDGNRDQNRLYRPREYCVALRSKREQRIDLPAPLRRSDRKLARQPYP